MAWDVVEEIDASDMSAALNKETTMSHEDMMKADYALQVKSLSSLLQETQGKMDQIKALSTSLLKMELEDPSLSKIPDAAAGLKSLLSEAKAAAEVNGPNSPQALEAWTNVESCLDTLNGFECILPDGSSNFRYSAAALKAHHYYDAVVDSVLLQEAVEAITTIDGLRRFVKVEDSRLSN